MEIRLGHPALDRAVAEVDTGADSLGSTRRRAATHVGRLLDGGWSGAAADSFADAWEEWLAGADQVLDGLRSIGAALELTGRELMTADATAGGTTARLTERLG